MVIEESSAARHKRVETEQIREKVGPSVQKRCGRLLGDALGAGGHNCVHQLFAFFGIRVFDKFADLLRFWQPPCQVQGNTPQELCVGAKQGMGDLIQFDLSKNVFVDEIFPGDGNGRRGRKCLAHTLCQAFELLRFALLLLRVMCHRSRGALLSLVSSIHCQSNRKQNRK